MIKTSKALIIPLAIALGACSAFQEGFKKGYNSADYTDAMREAFTSACTEGAAEKLGDQKAAAKYCECTFEKISETIPVEEYVKYDLGKDVKEETRTQFNVAVTQCGGDASKID